MDASTLIPALIGLIAPIVVSAIRKQSSIVQERTARLQYWKTHYELATLASNPVSDQAMQLCREEMAAGEDETRNLSNKTVSCITNGFTFVVMFGATLLIAAAHLDELPWRYQHQQAPSQATEQQLEDLALRLGYASLIFQTLVMLLLWFWARWKIRDFVWGWLKPGKKRHFLLTADRQKKALLGLVGLFLMGFAIPGIEIFAFQVFEVPQVPTP